jgi:alkylhydroperoxidase/carboxymuconolactone decarboxylase family protein YurZ
VERFTVTHLGFCAKIDRSFERGYDILKKIGCTDEKALQKTIRKEEEMITAMTKFEEFVGTAMGQGALDPKTKQLVGLAAALGSG